MSISQRIFEIMKEQKMTQKEFAKLTGISESTISDWKHKDVAPNSDKILDICSALDIGPYELLVDQDIEFATKTIDLDSELGIIVDSYEKLNLKQKARLLGYIQAMLEE